MLNKKLGTLETSLGKDGIGVPKKKKKKIGHEILNRIILHSLIYNRWTVSTRRCTCDMQRNPLTGRADTDKCLQTIRAV